MDPSVDVALPHDLRQKEVKLLPTDPVIPFLHVYIFIY